MMLRRQPSCMLFFDILFRRCADFYAASASLPHSCRLPPAAIRFACQRRSAATLAALLIFHGF